MKFLPAFVLAPLLSGCWYVKQGAGQLDLILNSRSVEDVAADPATSDEARRKLELIRDLKEFGERVMGLTPSKNYTSVYDTGGRPVTWIVTACRKDRFEPHTWWFPIVGTVPYKGHFAPEDAKAEAEGLEAEGLDVQVSPAGAYSTLGYFNDPILSTMYKYPDEELASLILHELTHGTIFLPDGVEFNEGLASFVGWQGALEFFRRRDGAGSLAYGRAVRALAREELRDARSIELFKRLDVLYRSDATTEEKLERRESIAAGLRAVWKAEFLAREREFEAAKRSDGDVRRAAERLAVLPGFSEGPVNNAAILSQRRYGRYDQFRKVFEEVGGDWPRFFAEMRKPAETRP